MKVADLTQEDEGRRIRVVSAAVGEAEKRGFVDDSKRLPGLTGVLEEARRIDGQTAQAYIKWDEPGCSLMLAGEDEVELLRLKGSRLNFCLQCGMPFLPTDEKEFCPYHAQSRERREWKIVNCTAWTHTKSLDEYEVALPADVADQQVSQFCREALEDNRGAWVDEVEARETSHYEIDDVEEVHDGEV